ncbi:hypothetical protein [Streptomyces oceani]|uniref:Uncharacterized protein n=1 Tax=Streptomyces oceani TaxID=1075402 RepID=A0A1E7JXN0_9ACTN|nr:hypothetical protein [Streptomyces oceani]OEU96414.1 hypothetical protein AN216_20760 [Streptomyces oceani]
MWKETWNLTIGVIMLAASAVLLLVFPDTEFLWFEGQPLGIVLAALGALDLYSYARARRRRTASEAIDG